jgi:imidazolonepropionase-like amidohydrolase
MNLLFRTGVIYIVALATFVSAQCVQAQDIQPGEEFFAPLAAAGISQAAPAPDRPAGEGAGPYERLVIRGATMIDGTGAPPVGPVDLVIEGNRIAEIRTGGTAGLPIGNEDGADARIIDASGMYVMPGFVDAHAHLSVSLHGLVGTVTPAEYVLKLWLAHGVTTAREVGSIMGLGWTLDHKRRSETNEITAPRLQVHAMFPERMENADAAREWVRAVEKRGADGLKFIGAAPELIEAAIDEARRLDMKTAYHHSQISVTRVNVLDSARMGLDSMEHWYGLPEAMFEDRRVQDYPLDYNYSNEQNRFGQAGRLWKQAAAPGSEKWNAVIEELLQLDFTLDPTFTIYEANRDVMRARRADWHDEYTLPTIERFYQPNRTAHGSYHFDWTTQDEIEWKENYRIWMQFVNDYKNRGGRVTTGSDSGFIYKLFGFGYIRELELLQEAGFHPLEVLQAATMNGAELLGMADEIGTIELGKKADLVIIDENPIANFKVLYGTGHMRLNDETDKAEQVGGINYTIKDGIIYDAKQLLADVRQMVADAKAAEAGTGQ